MFTTVMVPLDGSELAERALAPAQQLAAQAGDALHLVRVTPLHTSQAARAAAAVMPRAPYVPLIGAPYLSPRAPAAIHPVTGHAAPTSQLERVLMEQGDHGQELAARSQAATLYLEAVEHGLALATGMAAHTAHLVGEVSQCLLSYERSQGIELVVMCSHGHGGWSPWRRGPVADHLLRHGSVPLLLVGARDPSPRMELVVVPLDGSLRAEAALGIVRRLPRRLVEGVVLLHVTDGAGLHGDPERYLSIRAGELTADGLACRWEVQHGEPAGRIVELAQPDRLVVMATHGRSGLPQRVLGSVADQVAGGGAAGVLLVRS